MGIMKKLMAILVLLSLLFTIVPACAKSEERADVEDTEASENKASRKDKKKAADTDEQGRDAVDLFDMDLTVTIEHTYKEGDEHYLLALFPDGKTGFYQSQQPGVLPELRDLASGRATKITLSEHTLEYVEFMLRTSVILEAKRHGADTAKLEENLSSVHGLDILKSYPNPTAFRVQNACLTLTDSDLICLQDYNLGLGGMIDPGTGVLYNNQREENSTFSPSSAWGTSLLGVYGSIGEAATLDTAKFRLESLNLTRLLGYTPQGSCTCTTAAYLSDGSIAVILMDRKIENGDISTDYLLGIIPAKGKAELYDLGMQGKSSTLGIASADPDHVIAWAVQSAMDAPRLIDRKTGEITALRIKGRKIVSVPLDKAENIDAADRRISFLDVLEDGRTYIVWDDSSGALAIFRPDTMDTMLLTTDEYVGYCTNVSGDHKGRLCAMYMNRAAETERGILLTIVDKNGDRIFP